MKKYLYAAAACLTCLFLAWSAGYDFNERGFNTFMVAYITVALSWAAYMIGSIE